MPWWALSQLGYVQNNGVAVKQRLQRLERLVQEADAPPAQHPRDQARELLIAQVAEEGLRVAWDQGGPVREVLVDAFTQASAELERKDPTPARVADAQYWRDYQAQFMAAAEVERDLQPRCSCSVCATLDQACRTRERS